MIYKDIELINSFAGEDNELYITLGNNRYKFGECDITFKVYKESKVVPILNHDTEIKSYKIVIIVGDNLQCVKGQGIETLPDARALELVSKIRHSDGTSEKLTMNIQPNEIEVDGEWECELVDPEAKKKILKL